MTRFYSNQISITADSGVGSTTTAKCLHTLLGISPWRWVNAGAIMRIFAKEVGLTIEEFAEYIPKHLDEKYDDKCDDMIRHFGEQDYVIFEGRLVHHFAPGAFHVRLVCDPHIRATRRASDGTHGTVDEAYQKIVDRDEMNRQRYEKLYGSEVLWSDDTFDLVLDTGVLTPDDIAHKIVEGHKEWVTQHSNKI
jgi:cytidylate kinase